MLHHLLNVGNADFDEIFIGYFKKQLLVQFFFFSLSFGLHLRICASLMYSKNERISVSVILLSGLIF